MYKEEVFFHIRAGEPLLLLWILKNRYVMISVLFLESQQELTNCAFKNKNLNTKYRNGRGKSC